MSPHQKNLPTYSRGKTRIDYSFSSPNLLRYVRRAYITRVGITSSDHSAITIILDKSKLLETDITPHRASPRQVTQKNPASVYKYQRNLHKYFTRHRIFHKVATLKSRLLKEPEMSDETKIFLLDTLDAEVTRLMIAAERRCSKKKTFGIYHWSPELALAGKAYSHAKHVLRDFLREKKTGAALASAKMDVKMCRDHLRLTQDNASKKRQDHLQAIGELLTVSRNTAVKHTVQEILKVEEAKALARELKTIIPDKSNGPLDSVLIPNQNDNGWNRVNSAPEGEAAILHQNKKDLKYANQCPFLQSPLKEYLAVLGERNGADAVLNGEAKVDVSGFPNPVEVETLLSNLQSITTQESSGCPSRREYRRLYRKIRESTVSSPSGCHYGHYKAAYEISSCSKVLHDLTTLPLEQGLSLRRWQHSIHFMLQKKRAPLRK